MNTATKVPKRFVIPAGAIPTKCKSCSAQIYFAEQPSGARMPIEVRSDVDGSLHPSSSHGGMGVSHFAHCPGADVHRRPR